MSTPDTEKAPRQAPAPPEAAAPATTSDMAWLPYVAPMATFLLLTSLEGYLPQAGEGEQTRPHPLYYPLFYAAKVAIVAAVAVFYRRTWRDFRPWPGPLGMAAAVAIGLAVIAAWVGLDGLYPTFGMLGGRQAFNPLTLPAPGRWLFLAARAFGLVLLVPLVEELFWRSFLMRWIIDQDFERVPVGRVTAAAAGVTAALFAAAHPEWLPALLTGLAWAWLLRWTGSLSACLISHAVANLALGLYVLATGDWKYL